MEYYVVIGSTNTYSVHALRSVLYTVVHTCTQYRDSVALSVYITTEVIMVYP